MSPGDIPHPGAATPVTAVAHLRKDLGRLAFRGGLITASSQLVIFAVHLGSTMALARLLVPEDFGLVAMVAVFTGAALLFQDFGLSQATIQREDLTEPQLSALFWLNLGLGLALALLILALSPLISSFYGRPELVGIAAVAALALLPQAASIQHRALLVRQMRFGALRLAEVISVAFGAVVAVAMAALGYGYWSLAVMPLAGAAAFAVLVWPAAGWLPGRPRRAEGVGGLLRFGLHVTSFNGLNFLSRNADDLLIGWAWGAGALGFYSRAYALMMMPIRLLNVPLSAVAIPTLSRLTGDEARYREAYRRMVEKILLVALPIVGLLIGTADWVIEVLLGPGWEAAVAIFVWLGIAALYQPLAHTVGWLFISQGRTREFAQWGLISSPILVMSFVIGLPYGAVGVAASYALVGFIIATPLLFWFVGRRGPVTTGNLWNQWLPYLALAGVVAITCIGLRYSFNLVGPVPGLLVVIPGSLVAGGSICVAIPQCRRAALDLIQSSRMK